MVVLLPITAKDFSASRCAGVVPRLRADGLVHKAYASIRHGDVDTARMSRLGQSWIALARLGLHLELGLAGVREDRRPFTSPAIAPGARRVLAHLEALGKGDGVGEAAGSNCAQFTKTPAYLSAHGAIGISCPERVIAAAALWAGFSLAVPSVCPSIRVPQVFLHRRQSGFVLLPASP